MKEVDFCIIGGGIAGVSAAARVAPLGATLLMEAEPALGYHASGRSAALFEPLYGAPTVVDLSLAGENHLANAHGGVLSPRGIMMVCQPGQEETFAKEVAGFGMDPITLAEAQARVPILDTGRLTAAAQSDRAQDIDTDLLIQNFAREARAGGAEIRTDSPVTGISRRADRWTVSTPAGDVSARLVLNAAGAWADRVAEMAGIAPIGLQPYRRSMARVPAPSGHDVSGWPMLFGVGETWYAKPDAGQLLISPADEDPMDPFDAWPDDMVLAGGIARFSEVVTTEVTRLSSSWAGLRTFAPDRTLVIGFDPADTGFFWIAGQGGYGFQTSAGASRLVADLIGGYASELPPETVEALSPKRFR